MNIFSYKKWIAIVSLVAFCLLALTIFFLALQPGEQSDNLSKTISAFFTGIDRSHEKLDTDIEKVDLERITLSAKKAAYCVDDKLTLTVDASPANYTEGFNFSSSDESLAKVSDKGVVTFLAAGTVTITVTGKKGKVANDISFDIYSSLTQIDDLDKTQFALEIPDELPANDCKAVTVTYKGKPISLKFQLVSENEDVLSTRGSYVLTKAQGQCGLLFKVGDEVVLTKQMTVTDVTLEEPVVAAVLINDKTIPDGKATFYLGHNYNVGFDLENDDDAVKSYIMNATANNLKPTYLNSSSQLMLTANSCGENTVTVYSRTALDEPIASFTVTIVPPPAVVESIVTPEKGFLCGYDYEITMDVNDKNSLIGYEFTVYGKDFTLSADNKVRFNAAGEYKVVFTSSYYPTDVFEFTLIVIDEKAETAFRKRVGHFGLFALLGVFGVLSFCYFIKKLPNKAIITSIAGALVAIISEVFQLPLFTDARGFSVVDMLIDSAGYIVGGSLVILTLIIFYKVISRRRSSSPTEE